MNLSLGKSTINTKVRKDKAMETVGEESATLSQEEVAEAVSGESPEVEVQLPSEEVKFEMPEKFAGKSIEDVIKSYQELEKLKGGDVSQEEKVEVPTEETSKADKEQYQKYADSLDKNGVLSEAEYAELAEAGYTKEVVDAEIANRSDREAFESYKKDRALNEVLEPLGGGKEKFKEVSDWANTTKSVEEVTAFNSELATAGPLAKQALLRGLYSEYDTSSKETNNLLHSNTAPKTGSKGYTTQEEFFKDVGSEEYQTNISYRKAVEAKMALSSIF